MVTIDLKASGQGRRCDTDPCNIVRWPVSVLMLRHSIPREYVANLVPQRCRTPLQSFSQKNHQSTIYLWTELRMMIFGDHENHSEGSTNRGGKGHQQIWNKLCNTTPAQSELNQIARSNVHSLNRATVYSSGSIFITFWSVVTFTKWVSVVNTMDWRLRC